MAECGHAHSSHGSGDCSTFVTNRQPNQTRVQLRVKNETHAGAIKAALCTVSLGHMRGTAPPGHHERVLSKHLSSQEALT